MNYVVIVDDSGELKTVTATELENGEPVFRDFMEQHLNSILDKRAIAAGEYDPSDNDTPIEVVTG